MSQPAQRTAWINPGGSLRSQAVRTKKCEAHGHRRAERRINPHAPATRTVGSVARSLTPDPCPLLLPFRFLNDPANVNTRPRHLALFLAARADQSGLFQQRLAQRIIFEYLLERVLAADRRLVFDGVGALGDGDGVFGV